MKTIYSIFMMVLIQLSKLTFSLKSLVAFLFLFMLVAPVIEIVVYKSVIEMVLNLGVNNEGRSESLEGFVIIVLSLLLVLVVDLIKYFVQNGRIALINGMADQISNDFPNVNFITINWTRALFIDFSLVVIFLSQLVIFLMLAFYVEILGGVLITVLVVFSLWLVTFVFKKEYFYQKRMKFNMVESKQIIAAKKIKSRVRSSELVSLMSNAALIIGLILVVLIHQSVGVDVGAVIILLFLIRYLSINIKVIASSMMRISRALPFSEVLIKKYVGFV